MKPLPRLPASRYHGLTGAGDLVAAIAEPIARFADKHLGTHIEGCGGCASRRQWLNDKLPLSQSTEIDTSPPE